MGVWVDFPYLAIFNRAIPAISLAARTRNPEPANVRLRLVYARPIQYLCRYWLADIYTIYDAGSHF
jgi:hypothetical protein